MIRNILLTSLDTPESGNPLWYYSAQNEFSFSYCEARQCMEASAKYVLARFPIDEILVIGNEADPDGGKPFRLKDATAPDPADPKALSAIGLYRSRLAQYINELNPEEQAYDALLPEEQRCFVRGEVSWSSTQSRKRNGSTAFLMSCRATGRCMRSSRTRCLIPFRRLGRIPGRL